ncbi:MAG: amidase, partial [Acidobacteria bacterium]|nr:amidase [Acidobacteriota bacterium]
MTELHYLDATTALSMFRTRKLSPVELLDAVVERAETVNAPINAFTQTLFEEAVLAAKTAEARYVHGGSLPPLLGLPIATKEKHGIKGHTLSQGLVAQKDFRATENHPVV